MGASETRRRRLFNNIGKAGASGIMMIRLVESQSSVMSSVGGSAGGRGVCVSEICVVVNTIQQSKSRRFGNFL